MATEILVESPFDDGRRVVDQVVRDGFDVSAAFWVKTSEEGLWQLYIASPSVDEKKPGGAYRKVYAALAKVPGSCVSPSDVKLINDANPIARDVVAIRDRYPARLPIRYRGKPIGTMPVVEAYIYPPPVRPPVDEPSLKHGARVYLLDDGVAVVKQTVTRRVGQGGRYVIDGQRERHVDPGDDAALGAAVRAALEGRL